MSVGEESLLRLATTGLIHSKEISMIDIVKRFKCDACGKEVCCSDSKNVPSWTVSTEVGDLCPSCSNAWENHKQSFIERMRKENGANLV